MSVGAGTILSGNIVLERELGRGAMGVVWAAKNQSLDSAVAVKVLPAAIAKDPQARARFAREARSAARIDSPHVVRVFDFGVTGEGEPFIVMERLVGQDLRAHLDDAGQLATGEVAELLRQMGLALDRAHELGIVHRDVKPANVFLVDAGRERLVKLLDFGIAKLATDDDPSMTASHALLGTPHYMSPEQLVSPRSVDARSDLWSVATLAYVCLVDALPFEGDSVGALSLSVHRGEFPAPSSVRPELPPELDAWFRRALDRDPDARFQTARELATTFAEACGAEPSSAARRLPAAARPRRARADEARRESARAPAYAEAPTLDAPGSSGSRSTARSRSTAEEETNAVASTIGYRLGPPLAGRLATLVAVLLFAGAGAALWARAASEADDATPRVAMDADAPADVPASSTGGSEPPQPAAAAPAPRTARVQIRPEAAQVTVNGSPAPVEGGAIELTGHPGDSFVVSSTHRGTTLERTVVLGRDGSPAPDVLHVSPPPAPAAPRASAPPETRKLPVKPAASAASAASAVIASPAPPSAPPVREAWE